MSPVYGGVVAAWQILPLSFKTHHAFRTKHQYPIRKLMHFKPNLILQIVYSSGLACYQLSEVRMITGVQIEISTYCRQMTEQYISGQMLQFELERTY
jgi:hypothetical protein